MTISAVVKRTIAALSTIYSSVKSINALQSVRHFTLTQTLNMKILQFAYPDNPDEIRAGYLIDDYIVDINKADPSIPSTVIEILKKGDIDKVQKMSCNKDQPIKVPLNSVILKAPVHGMDKVLGIGLNYMDHCAEQNITPPLTPMVFSKFPSCVIGPHDALLIREEVTQKVDWEVELAVVIGKKGSQICADEAPEYIFGYTVAQDISARDWQKEKNSGQFTLGKGMETFCPIGPWIVTPDELYSPECLVIKCSVNGELKQQSNTCQLIHKINNLIERISSVTTLQPGDLILTGTPGGVGVHRKPPEFLKPGDMVTSEIQCIGVLTTRVEKYVNPSPRGEKPCSPPPTLPKKTDTPPSEKPDTPPSKKPNT